jgi:hypothetical protein
MMNKILELVVFSTGNNCHTLKHAALDLRSAHTQYKETTQLIVLKIGRPSPKCGNVSYTLYKRYYFTLYFGLIHNVKH